MLINHLDFKKMFFTDYHDIIQSTFVFVFSLVLIMFILVHVYIHVRYQRNTENKREVIRRGFDAFFVDIRLNQYGTFFPLMYFVTRYLVVIVYI